MFKLLDQNKIDMQFLRDLWASVAFDKIYNIYQYLIGIRLCSVLAKCWKWSEMAKYSIFLLISARFIEFEF